VTASSPWFAVNCIGVNRRCAFYLSDSPVMSLLRINGEPSFMVSLVIKQSEIVGVPALISTSGTMHLLTKIEALTDMKSGKYNVLQHRI